jgi:protoporphyrinogen oxidase
MKIAIIGAGIGGMAAAHDLANAGHTVTIFEAASYVGGLAAGFKEPNWNSSVEQFYHHWFLSDKDMFDFQRELGLFQNMRAYKPKTVAYANGKFYRLDSPLAALTFPGYNFFGMVRFGLATVFLRYLAAWQPLEKVTAHEWMRKYFGEQVYAALLEPLLQGKFGPHYKDVNMAWFWARIKARTTQLATYQGGFQAFADDAAAVLRKRGIQILLNTPIRQIAPNPDGTGVTLSMESGDQVFDRVLATTSPALLARLAPALPQKYLQGLLNLKNMGAVVLVLSLKQPLSEEGYYWFNLPKSAGYPFLALVEHTNLVPPSEFGGERIIYIGDYLDTDHEHFSLTKEQLLEKFLPSLTKFNPKFTPAWINKTWLFKTSYAQPIPLVNHSQNIPEIQTPIPGLFFASMSQVYPWDRGTNFAVQIGRKAARLILDSSPKE